MPLGHHIAHITHTVFIQKEEYPEFKMILSQGKSEQEKKITDKKKLDEKSNFPAFSSYNCQLQLKSMCQLRSSLCACVLTYLTEAPMQKKKIKNGRKRTNC